MNILETNRKGAPHETIKEYMKRAACSSTYELEWIYGSSPRNTLTKPEFLKLLHDLRASYKFAGETNNLDVKLQYVKLERSGLSDVRCTIGGIQNIKRYCKTNSLSDIPTCTFMKKESTKDDHNPSRSFKQIMNTDYNFRINIKKETDLDEKNEDVIKFKDNIKDGLKYYRYKKRFSFVTDDNLFRIDLTAVKSNTYNPKRKTYNFAKSLLESRILTGKEIYELEIEYIGYQMVNGKHPVVEYSNKVYSDWSSESLSSEDYKKQQALTSHVSGPSFSPGDNHYIDDDNSGYDFMDSYGSIDDVVDEPANDGYFVEEAPSHSMQTPWAQAACLKGKAIDLIYMNYWYPDKQWLFWGIMNNKKSLLFDGVEENFTAKYEDAPKNSKYVKYTVYPKFTDEEKQGKLSFPDGESGDEFYVPFHLIMGLESPSSSDNSDKAGAPSWGPKGHSKLSKDSRFIDTLNLKFNEVITHLLREINDSNLVVGSRKRNMILEEYKTLTEQESDKVAFIGPNPVSMGREMMNPDNPHSILRGYAVTEKADGIRAELFIDKAKQGYLITQKKEVIHTGSTFNNVGSCILDGEYITKDRKGNAIQLFMVFDIYYMDKGDNPVHPYTLPYKGKPGESCRSSIIHEFKQNIQSTAAEIGSLRDGVYSYLWQKDNKKCDPSDLIRLGFKRYYEGPKTLKKDKADPTKYTNMNAMGKLSKKILDLDKADNFEYSIDGLIYLPLYYSVGSASEDNIKNSPTGTWYQNYKWKPPEENTIDFRVRLVKEMVGERKENKITSFTKNKKTIQCMACELFVGYDIKRDITTDFTWKVMGHDKRRTNEILFGPPFEPNSIHMCNIPVHKGKILCQKDKTELQDGLIYEMRYEPNNPFGFQWLPLRVRSDKERPNASSTADSVWHTIKYPVTEGDLTSAKFVSHEEPIQEDEEIYSYYNEDNDSDGDISVRAFHNYIKDKLIHSITSLDKKPIAILDTSIGRGGDIGKYIRSKAPISFFMGLDISPDVNKAAKKLHLMGNTAPKVSIILQYDTSKSIKGGHGCVGKHVDRNKLMIDILYDRQKKLPQELRTLVPKYKGLAKKGFDLISCQFTIHYYFSDEISLRNYIQNISENLKEGGHFIGTCYDGMKVFKQLQENEGHMEMVDEFGNKVYSITKQYDMEKFDYKKDDRERLFGQKIDVYMNSIGKTFSEYLVNFELLIDIMKEYDLVLAKPSFTKDYKGFFDNKDLQYTDGLGGFEQIIGNLDKLYSKDLSLKQHFPESFALIKEKNKLLRDLSSLNNWFIFEKKTH